MVGAAAAGAAVAGDEEDPAAAAAAAASTPAGGAGVQAVEPSPKAVPPAPAPPASGQRKRKRRKNKGFLAPGGEGEEWGMSEAERRTARGLRERLGVPAGHCPSLDELRQRLPEVLDAMHADLG